MKLGDVLANLGRPVAYYPNLARVCGGVKACLVLCQLAYWHGKQRNPDGWIRKGWPELEAETGLTEQEQRTGRAALRRLGLIEERLRGIPATLEYRLVLDVLDGAFSSLPATKQFVGSNELERCQQRTIPETTSETTAENKDSSLAPLASVCAADEDEALRKQQDPTDLPQAADATNSKVDAANFDRWYSAYPKKRKPAKARAAWMKQRAHRPPLVTMLAALESQKTWQDWRKDGGQYIPAPEAYLNGHCWADVEAVDLGRPKAAPRNLELERIAARERELGIKRA